jgi:hypothetical protein
MADSQPATPALVTEDVYATVFRDIHREFYNMHFDDDIVAVELSLNGSHKLKDGKVLSFDCYVATPILLEQIGVFKNLSAAIRK